MSDAANIFTVRVDSIVKDKVLLWVKINDGLDVKSSFPLVAFSEPPRIDSEWILDLDARTVQPVVPTPEQVAEREAMLEEMERLSKEFEQLMQSGDNHG